MLYQQVRIEGYSRQAGCGLESNYQRQKRPQLIFTEAYFVVIFKVGDGAEAMDAEQPRQAFKVVTGTGEGCKWNKGGKKFTCKTHDSKTVNFELKTAGDEDKVAADLTKKPSCKQIDNSERDSYGDELFISSDTNPFPYTKVTLDGNSMGEDRTTINKKPIVEHVGRPIKKADDLTSLLASYDAWQKRASKVESLWGTILYSCDKADPKVPSDKCPKEKGAKYAYHLGAGKGSWYVLEKRSDGGASRQVNFGATFESLMHADFPVLFSVASRKTNFEKCQKFANAYAGTHSMANCESKGFMAAACFTHYIYALKFGSATDGSKASSPLKGDFDILPKAELFVGRDGKAVIDDVAEKNKIKAAWTADGLKVAFKAAGFSDDLARKMGIVGETVKTGSSAPGKKKWSTTEVGKTIDAMKFSGLSNKLGMIWESRSNSGALNKLMIAKNGQGLIDKINTLASRTCA